MTYCCALANLRLETLESRDCLREQKITGSQWNAHCYLDKIVVVLGWGGKTHSNRLLPEASTRELAQRLINFS